MSASIPLVRPAERLERHSSEPRRAGSLKPTIWRILNACWLHCIILAAAAFLVHLPALQGERIWDDQYLAHDNPFIKSPFLIPEAFRHYLFLDSFSAHYRPVQNISFIFDYFFWSTDEFGFHLTNVLLHAGSGIALYFLLRQLFQSFFFGSVPIGFRDRAQTRMPWISKSSFPVALFWVVHPVHSAAVDYISGRADSLAFFFAAAGWILFLKAQNLSRAVPRFAVYSLAATSGLLGLLSREIACVWIVLFVAHLLCVEKGILFRRRLGAVICCIAILAIYAGLRQLPAERSVSPSQPGWTAPVRAALMARALGDYARLIIFPANLHMERTVVDPISWHSNADWRNGIRTEYLSIFGLLLVAILAFGCIKAGRGRMTRIFGASWFLVAYLPVSNIVQLNATVAEHWLYLPMVGILIFLCGCAFELPRSYQPAVVLLAIIAVASLGLRSFVRSGDWTDEETFYKHTFEAGGTSGRVGVNLGHVYAGRGDYAGAERIFRSVLQQNPDYPLAQNNLADVLYRQGKKKEAETVFAQMEKTSVEARKQYPRTWIGVVNLATVRHNAHDNQAALAALEKARRDYPGVWEVIRLEAEILRQTQGPDAALPLVQGFASKNWWHGGAALALGRLYSEKGDVDLAEAALRRASWLDVHDAEALHLIALIKLRQNHLEEAFRAQRRAISRQPDQPSQYILLSNILEKMGRNDEARAALAQVSRLRALVNNQTVIN